MPGWPGRNQAETKINNSKVKCSFEFAYVRI